VVWFRWALSVVLKVTREGQRFEGVRTFWYYTGQHCCVFYVTLRRVRATIVVVEKQWILHNLSVFVCICSLRYPACNAHAPYCHLWPARLYNIFPRFLIKWQYFLKKQIIELKMCVLFSLQLLSETFLVIRRIQRDMVKNVRWFSCKVPGILVPLPEDLS
jgi:hypothetical protein